MSIFWRPGAEAAFTDAVAYLLDRHEGAAGRFRDDVLKACAVLDRRPQIARASSYPGFRAWSLPSWSKLIIFREVAEGIEIAALLDVRGEPPRIIK